MRRVSPLTYVADIGEQITIRVIQSTGIAELVNYSIDGTSNLGSVPKNDPCIFTVDRPLLVGQTGFFTDQSGGSFTTRVEGAAGGDPPDHVPYNRAGTEAFHTLVYTFLTPALFASLGPDLAALPDLTPPVPAREITAGKSKKSKNNKSKIKTEGKKNEE